MLNGDTHGGFIQYLKQLGYRHIRVDHGGEVPLLIAVWDPTDLDPRAAVSSLLPHRPVPGLVTRDASGEEADDPRILLYPFKFWIYIDAEGILCAEHRSHFLSRFRLRPHPRHATLDECNTAGDDR